MTAIYEKTRQAWRDIWSGTEFDLELKALEHERSQEIMRTYLPFIDRRLPVLEAGCGPGHVVYYLNHKGYNSVGLDYAPEALKPTLVQHPDLPLHMGDVHHLPYSSNTFGSYLSFGVVEHFEHGPLPALREAYRVLQSAGALIITVPHPQVVETMYQVSTKLFPKRYERLGSRAGYYERTYTHQELAECIKAANFKIQVIKPVGHSFTWYGLHRIFRTQGYYETSSLAETMGSLSRRILPWQTAFHSLIIATKS